ncbi:hypothetical protein N7517_003904 [Penicillium concentricum]|uniref:Uncharacterized protein n=1 Tax=Penicillium concentricum TaxID=293559 RepID=A0A9W9S4H3_9EURO|nr:uncharacterized protein N7517_003904 [Penicillium concentricum]KAJ5371898.1 hypothetical protein N7517_003904 [Penicillium concentricum]
MTVVFCHASIRDYLRNSGYGKVSAGDGSTPVGIDIVQASVNTLNVCLSAIVNGSDHVVVYVHAYALNEWTMELIISLFADQECVNTIHDLDTRKWIHHLRPPPVASVDTVLEVARWAQFEENACWHHRVGACLRSLGHVDAAIEHLNTALALEPIWRAKIELAKVYETQGQLDNSLQLLRECEAQYTRLLMENNDEEEVEDIARDLSELRNDLGSLHIQLGDYSNATHCFMTSIELWDPVYISYAVPLVIRVLVASQCSQYERIMQVLKKIDTNPWHDDADSVLFGVLRNNFGDWQSWDNTQLLLIFAVLAKRCNNLQWLECKYQSEIAERKTKLGSIDILSIKESLAHLYDKFLGEEEKAVSIWKSIIAQHRVRGSLQYETFCRTRNRAVAAYAYRLLTNGLRETGNFQALIVQELETVCDNEIESMCYRVLFDGQSGIYMGIWHKLNGREEEARDYFRPYVLQAVFGCDENISLYDMKDAQRVLGHLFAMIGDDEDAIALLQLTHSPFTIRDGTSASAEERMASPWPLVVEARVWYCHICLNRGVTLSIATSVAGAMQIFATNALAVSKLMV